MIMILSMLLNSVLLQPQHAVTRSDSYVNKLGKETRLAEPKGMDSVRFYWGPAYQCQDLFRIELPDAINLETSNTYIELWFKQDYPKKEIRDLPVWIALGKYQNPNFPHTVSNVAYMTAQGTAYEIFETSIEVNKISLAIEKFLDGYPMIIKIYHLPATVSFDQLQSGIESAPLWVYKPVSNTLFGSYVKYELQRQKLPNLL